MPGGHCVPAAASDLLRARQPRAPLGAHPPLCSVLTRSCHEAESQRVYVTRQGHTGGASPDSMALSLPAGDSRQVVRRFSRRSVKRDTCGFHGCSAGSSQGHRLDMFITASTIV